MEKEVKEPRLLSIKIGEDDKDLEFVFKNLMEWMKKNDERYILVIEIEDDDPVRIRKIKDSMDNFFGEDSIPSVIVPPYSKVTLVETECYHILCRACGQCGKCGKSFRMGLHTDDPDCVEAFTNAVTEVDSNDEI